MSDHHARTYVVTGADSGIGALTAETLQERGARAIRCGIATDAEVRADIGDAQGRATLVREVHHPAPEGIDGLAFVAEDLRPFGRDGPHQRSSSQNGLSEEGNDHERCVGDMDPGRRAR